MGIRCTGAEAIALVIENNLATSYGDIARQLSNDNLSYQPIQISTVAQGRSYGKSKSTRVMSEHMAMRFYDLYDIEVIDRFYFSERKR